MTDETDTERARWEAEAEAARDANIERNRHIAHKHLSEAATNLRLADRAVRRLSEQDLFDVEFEGDEVAYVNARAQIDVALAALRHIVPSPSEEAAP